MQAQYFSVIIDKAKTKIGRDSSKLTTETHLEGERLYGTSIYPISFAFRACWLILFAIPFICLKKSANWLLIVINWLTSSPVAIVAPSTAFNIKETLIKLGFEAKGIKCELFDINENYLVKQKISIIY